MDRSLSNVRYRDRFKEYNSNQICSKARIAVVKGIACSWWHMAILVGGNGLDASRCLDIDGRRLYGHVGIGVTCNGNVFC